MIDSFEKDFSRKDVYYCCSTYVRRKKENIKFFVTSTGYLFVTIGETISTSMSHSLKPSLAFNNELNYLLNRRFSFFSVV